MRQLILSATATLLTAALFAAATTEAATYRRTYRTATGICQPATPLQLGGLRFRPAGIYNNKSEAIYISCSLDTDYEADDDLTDLSIQLTNQGSVTQVIECTAQGGHTRGGYTNVSKTLSLAPGETDPIVFGNLRRRTEGHEFSVYFSSINLSCLLPSKVLMTTIMMYEEDSSDRL